VNEYIKFGDKSDLDLRDLITDKIKTIAIAPEFIEIPELGRSDKIKKAIILSNDLLIDSLILKIILFREISYMLGIDYDSSIIMERVRNKGFTYSIFNRDILNIEMGRIMESF